MKSRGARRDGGRSSPILGLDWPKMGTLAKRLQQLASRAMETESSNIIKMSRQTSAACSKALDTTLIPTSQRTA